MSLPLDSYYTEGPRQLIRHGSLRPTTKRLNQEASVIYYSPKAPEPSVVERLLAQALGERLPVVIMNPGRLPDFPGRPFEHFRAQCFAKEAILALSSDSLGRFMEAGVQPLIPRIRLASEAENEDLRLEDGRRYVLEGFDRLTSYELRLVYPRAQRTSCSGTIELLVQGARKADMSALHQLCCDVYHDVRELSLNFVQLPEELDQLPEIPQSRLDVLWIGGKTGLMRLREMGFSPLWVNRLNSNSPILKRVEECRFTLQPLP